MISYIVNIVQNEAVSHPLRLLFLISIVIPLAYVFINEIIRYKARLPSFSGPTGLPVRKLMGNSVTLTTWSPRGVFK
jgi:3-hydroxyphenylacetate 6-hydroxylase